MSFDFHLYNSNHKNLDALAICHADCFPESLSAKLGNTYIKKSLEWFLTGENRFLFHVEIDGIEVGYCGGFIPRYYGEDSNSGILQFAFIEAFWGIAKKPFLVFNKEVISFFVFIFRGIKNKIFSESEHRSSERTSQPKRKYTELVVIGIEPMYRGTVLFPALMNYFEEHSKLHKILLCKLSVKKDNQYAVKAYKKVGWYVADERAKTFVMQKSLS